MSKFIELKVILPIRESQGRLVGLRYENIFVNTDTIASFKEKVIPYPTIIDEYYAFHQHVNTNSSYSPEQIWAAGTVTELDCAFDNMALEKDKYMSFFNDLSFARGVLISFKPGLSPLEDQQSLYATNPSLDFTK